MSDNKRFIYFPSLSAGSMVSAFKKDMKFTSGDPVKFFDSRYPEKWRHPYFLITAGHHYKKNLSPLGLSGRFIRPNLDKLVRHRKIYLFLPRHVLPDQWRNTGYVS